VNASIGLPTLQAPSLGVVRARLIQERLVSAVTDGRALPQVAVTGKTGSGKSTLGNLLVGITGLLRTTGLQDCTDSADLIRFPRGLTYVDLPGVASDDELENLTRSALGLRQQPRWPLAELIRIREYSPDGQAAEHYYPAGDLPSGLIAPDLVLYLIAPQQSLSKAEEPYLKDLISAFPSDRVVFVLNLFHGGSGERVATAQNLEDVRRKLERWHRQSGTVLDPSRVVALDCKTGEGLDLLLAAAHRCLGPHCALADVIAYQQEHAPEAFLCLIRESVARFAAGMAPLDPGSDQTATDIPVAAARRLLEFAGRLGAVPLDYDPEPWLSQGRALAAQVVRELRHESVEPIVEHRSEDVYEDVPVHSWVEEEDYDRPVYDTRSRRVDVAPEDLDGLIDGVRNWWKGRGFVTERWETYSVVVGYAKTSRQVVTGYRKEYLRTEQWDEVVGERVVDITYEPLGECGVAFALAAFQAALGAAGQTRARAWTGSYKHALNRVRDHGSSAEDLLQQGAELFAPAAERRLSELPGLGRPSVSRGTPVGSQR
jgi:GTPase Era involved in 16S rRNA processing